LKISSFAKHNQRCCGSEPRIRSKKNNADTKRVELEFKRIDADAKRVKFETKRADADAKRPKIGAKKEPTPTLKASNSVLKAPPPTLKESVNFKRWFKCYTQNIEKTAFLLKF